MLAKVNFAALSEKKTRGLKEKNKRLVRNGLVAKINFAAFHLCVKQPKAQSRKGKKEARTLLINKILVLLKGFILLSSLAACIPYPRL